MKKIITLFAAVAATLLALTSCDGLNEDPATVPKGTHFNATYSAQDGGKALKIMFTDNGTVRFYQDEELCGAATYTVTEDGTAQIATALFTKPWGSVSASDTATPLTATATFSGDDLRIVLNGKTLAFTKNTTSSETTPPGNDDDDNTGNTSGTTPGGNDDDTSGTTPGGNTSETNPGDNTGTTTPGNNDDDGNTNPGGNDDDDKNNVGIIPRGSRIAAKYEQKVEFAFYADGTAVMTWGWPVSGTYTTEANGDLIVRMPYESDFTDEMVYLAKINGDTMTLYFYDEDENLTEEAAIMTKKAMNTNPSALTEWEWNGPLSLTFDLDGTVQFLEDAALCWTGTYTVTKDNFAVTQDIHQVGNPWDNMAIPLKVEFTFDGNALTWDTDGASSFLTRVGDLTVKTPTSDDNTNPGEDGDDDKSDDDEHNAGVFKNGAIDATYTQKLTLTFADGMVAYDVNGLNTDSRTTYKQDGDTRTFDYAKLIGANDDDMQMQATATIKESELTLKLTVTEDDDNGEIQTSTSEHIFKKSSTGADTWEYALKLSLSSKKNVSFYEQDKLCWTGNYAITDERNATVSNVTIADQAIFDSIFGNDTKIVALWDGRDEDVSVFWIRYEHGSGGIVDMPVFK